MVIYRCRLFPNLNHEITNPPTGPVKSQNNVKKYDLMLQQSAIATILCGLTIIIQIDVADPGYMCVFTLHMESARTVCFCTERT